MAKKKATKKVKKATNASVKVAVPNGITEAKDAPDENAFKGGVKRPKIQNGPLDYEKIALTAMGGRGGKTAGMMMQDLPAGNNVGNTSLPAYNTSYAGGGSAGQAGTRDIPPYFVMMNEQNGGILYWPVTLIEKYSWYRYFARTDAYVGRSLELLSDLPMSKITLNMPKVAGTLTRKKRDEIQDFYTYMCDELGMFERLQEVLWEYNLIGNAYPFCEWDSKRKCWSKISLLPPEEVGIFKYPFSDHARVEYNPERLIQLIKGSQDGEYGQELDSISREILEKIPKDIVDMVKKEGCIVMDTDPNTGSFVHHIARRRSPYMDLGVSVLERVLIPMLQKEHYRYTQLGLASRNMTPTNVISAEGLSEAELGDLRAQVDLRMLDPDYSIVTNYGVDWNQIGADARLLDLSAEYEQIENQIFAGLGVTRELLTGEGAYSGTKITVEILNTMFLLTREILQNFVEKQLFQPVAEAHGWYEEKENGVKKYWYPKLGFNRLSIRDNQEVFDSLFQLYQKGSMPVDIIYELFNLNVDDIHEKIQDDLFTVKDPNFNRIVEEVSSGVGSTIAEMSDAKDKISEYMGFKMSESADEGGGGEDGWGEDETGGEGEESGDWGDESSGETSGDVTEIADGIAEQLPDDATEEEIVKLVDEVVPE